MSHYIPVGKLKIDKAILDIACPAAGYGSTPPPVEVYCPAAGYELKYPEYVPPAGMILPESVPQSIIFICNSNFGVWTYTTFAKAGTTSSYLYEIFDLTGTLVDSFTTTASTAQTFAFPEPKGYYVVRVTLTNPGGYFTTMGSGLSSQYFVIEKIIFNTPNFTSLANSCKYMAGLRSVEFNCTLDLVTSFQYAFQYSGLYSFEFLSSYPALTNMQYMFQYCPDISKIEFPSYCNLPLVTSMSYFAGYSSAKTILLPNAMPELLTIVDLCRDAKNLNEIRHIQSAPKLTTANYAFSGTALIGEVSIPVYPAVNSATYFFSNNNPLTKIKFIGNAIITANYQNMFQNNRKLQEIEYPAVFGTTAGVGLQSNLIRKIVLPNTLPAASSGVLLNYCLNTSLNLEEVTGDFDNSLLAEQVLEINYNSLVFKKWNTPKLRCSSIRIGFTGAANYYIKLETLEVDWANSTFSAVGPGSVNIEIWANVSAAWLNSLFTKLPTLAGKTIRVSGCTGYATCDPSIATAKGWTVL